QRLRDAVRPRAGVLRVGVPVALALPEPVEAAPLVGAPAVGREHLLRDRARVAAGVGDRLRGGTAGAGGARAGGARGARGARGAGGDRPGADEDDLVDGLGRDHRGQLLAVEDLAVGVGGPVGRDAGALDALGLDARGAARQLRRLALDGPERQLLDLGLDVRADALDDDL